MPFDLLLYFVFGPFVSCNIFLCMMSFNLFFLYSTLVNLVVLKCLTNKVGLDWIGFSQSVLDLTWSCA